MLDVPGKAAGDDAGRSERAAPPAPRDKAPAWWKQPKVQLVAAAAGGALVASLLAVLITSLGDDDEVTAEPASTPQVEPAPQSTPPPPRPKPKPAPPRPAAPIAEKTKPAQQSEASAARDSSAQPAAKAPEVEVRASPEGALIFYGGKRVGETTARFAADPDKPKLLLVTKHGYIPQRMPVDGSQSQISVELERAKKEERGGHASGRVQQAADNPY